MTGNGDGSPENWKIADENYKIKHDCAGILGLSSVSNVRHSASTQFHITLDALDWMDGKAVAFGRVIDGEYRCAYRCF